MKKSRFSESHIITILKEAAVVLKVAEIFRKHGISHATYYHWKARYVGLAMSDISAPRGLLPDSHSGLSTVELSEKSVR
jgi:putative transposase